MAWKRSTRAIQAKCYLFANAQKTIFAMENGYGARIHATQFIFVLNYKSYATLSIYMKKNQLKTKFMRLKEV